MWRFRLVLLNKLIVWIRINFVQKRKERKAIKFLAFESVFAKENFVKSHSNFIWI